MTFALSKRFFFTSGFWVKSFFLSHFFFWLLPHDYLRLFHPKMCLTLQSFSYCGWNAFGCLAQPLYPVSAGGSVACVCVCLRTLMFILFIYVFASNEQCDIQEGWGYWTKLTEKHASCSLVPTPSFPFIIFGYMAWWTPVVAGPTRTGDGDDGAHRWF